MKFVIRFLFGLVLGMTIALASLKFGHGEQRYTPIVEKSINTVVKVTSRYIVMSKDPGSLVATPHFYTTFGSGVLISPNGHILTCEHVVDGNPFLIQVQLYGSTTHYIMGRVLLRSVVKDVAILKLVNYSTPTVYATLANGEPRVGDEVIAIGNPLGFDWSASAGIVSGLNRDGLAVSLIQTDAAINPGNSGGPLFDLEGKVVGLNESKIPSADNMGFAVSVKQIREFLQVFQGLDRVF